MRVRIKGVDVSENVNEYLQSATFTDNSEDDSDDLQLQLDDRDGVWLEWLGKQGTEDVKGSKISAVMIQHNHNDDGKDRALDCGEFSIDDMSAAGPPSRITIKATSLPYTSTIRKAKTTREWEHISLRKIAEEIAKRHKMTCMFLSYGDVYYKRRSQVQVSDIKFLKRLCKAAGISLKVTNNLIVLFDEAEFEKKKAVTTIKRGSSDVLSYRFRTSLNDTKYSACRVSYTDPDSGNTIEYTFTAPKSNSDDPVLEVNEKVESTEDARRLARKRLREKNRFEYQADFTLVGDVGLVAGSTVNVSGWGFYDGKYIIDSARHGVGSSGHTVAITLHRVLEGY